MDKRQRSRINHLVARAGAASFALLLPVVLSACSPRAGAQNGSADRRVGPLVVTTTTGMIADATRNVGGGHVEVTALMGPGVDPHLYKATQGDLEKLSEADLILYNGLHLEGKMADVLVKMARTVNTVQVTESIPENLLRQPAEFGGQYDPHVWFDVSLWIRVVERIRDALSEADPVHRADYERNAAEYLVKLRDLDGYARERIASIPKQSRVLITAHDAFGYFGEAYDIEVMGLQGISTSAEYGAQDLARLVDVIVDRRIKAVFIETSISPKSIEALVRGVEGRGGTVAIGGQLYSDAMGDEGTPEGTYIGMVRHNVETITGALQ